MTEDVKVKLEIFEGRLKKVNDMSLILKKAVSLSDETGLPCPKHLLEDYMSSILHDNNWLSIAAIELINEVNKGA